MYNDMHVGGPEVITDQISGPSGIARSSRVSRAPER